MLSSPSLSARESPGLTPEARICLAFSQRSPAELAPELVEWLGREGSFELLMAASVHHGIAGLVLTGLARLARANPLEPRLSGEIDAALALVRRTAIFWVLEQSRVLQFLDREGLTPVVLKGGALRHLTYGDPVERTMGDLDLLVEHARASPVLEALGRLGYSSPYPEGSAAGFRAHHYHERVARRGFEIELHWGLTRPDANLRLDPDLVLRRARRIVPPEGGPLLVPSPEDNLLHAVSQSEQGAVRKLSRIVDVDRIVASAEIDWDYVRREATRAGLDGFLTLTLRLAHLTLGTPTPGELRSGKPLGPVSRRAIAAFNPLRHLMEPPRRGQVPRDLLFRFWAHAGADAKIGMLKEVLTAKDDPLEWIWELHQVMHGERKTVDGSRRPVRGSVLLLKMGLIQTLLAPRAIGGWGFPGFWGRPEAGHGSNFFSPPSAHP